MTKLYEFRVVAIIKVEADHIEEAQAFAEEVAEELNGVLPVGVTLIHKNGHVEVNFEQEL